MGFFSKFEGKMEDTFEGAAGKMNNAPISPVQIMKKAEKQMRREKMVSAGREFAPTLYTVLVNADDDQRLFGFYPTLAGETETRLESAAASEGLAMDGKPLVRFIVDESLKHGKFDVIAEVVSAPIIAQLRDEELQRYGMAPAGNRGYAQPQQQRQPQPAYQQQYQQAPAYQQAQPAYAQPQQPRRDEHDFFNPANPAQGYAAAGSAGAYAAQAAKPPLPQVDESEIDYDANYGEYTFNSANFSDPNAAAQPAQPVAQVPPVVEPAQQAAPAAANPQRAQAFAQPQAEAVAQPQAAPHFNIPQIPTPQPAVAPEAAPAYPGAFPATYPAGGAGAFPDVEHVAEAAGGAPGMPANAAYAGVPGTVAFTAGAAQVNAVPNGNAVRARLIDVASNRSYDLATNRVLLGRETGNDIVVNDLNASRQHAQIEFEPQGVWVITDLGSTNGTLVNGAPITRRGLADGDRITLGITDFIFSLR